MKTRGVGAVSADIGSSLLGKDLCRARRSVIAVAVAGLMVACASSDYRDASTPEEALDTTSIGSHLHAGAVAGIKSNSPQPARKTPSPDPVSLYLANISARWAPELRNDDRDKDGVADRSDNCPHTELHVTVNREGCGLFDEVLDKVVFTSGSLWLTFPAKDQLNLLAQSLSAFPEARVLIRAHTDSQGPAFVNQDLSRRRAEIISQYLQLKGVSELQLQTEGVGESEPLDSNATSEGRLTNRRIQVVTLTELGSDSSETPVQIANTTKDKALNKKPAQFASNSVVPASESSVHNSSVSGTIRPDELNNTELTATPSARVPFNDIVKSDLTTSTDAVGDRIASTHRSDDVIDNLEESDITSAIEVSGAQIADFPATTTGTAIRLPRAVSAEKFAQVLAMAQLSRPSADWSGTLPLKPLPAPGIAPEFPVRGVLSGVKFATGRSDLSDDARQSLQPLLDALLDNKEVDIAIMAHTDNIGGAAANKALSVQRAENVVAYLVQSGVSNSRLIAEGYGELLPLAQNVTDADRARNRRVEVRVLADRS